MSIRYKPHVVRVLQPDNTAAAPPYRFGTVDWLVVGDFKCMVDRDIDVEGVFGYTFGNVAISAVYFDIEVANLVRAGYRIVFDGERYVVERVMLRDAGVVDHVVVLMSKDDK